MVGGSKRKGLNQMKNLPNIEASAFNRGVYVGYATYKGAAVVYRIRRDGGAWVARNHQAPTLRQRTLTAMSDSLADLALTPVNA